MTSKRLKDKKVPNLRFPGFDGEWERKKLGEVMDFKVTNSFSRENLNYEIGTVKNIHYGDIHTKFQTLFDIQKEEVPFVNEEINLNRISEDNYCKEGDIIFADASEDLNDVGKSTEIINVNNEKLLSGLHTLLARPKSNTFYLGFKGYLFKSNSIRTQIQKESQGSKVLSINVGRISKVELSFPNIKEQEKIASFLSLIDERISTQNKIIEELKLLKITISKKLFSRQLRFKNGNNENYIDWNTKKLGEVTTLVNKRNKNNEKLPVYSINNKLGFVPQSEQFEGVDSEDRGYDIKLYKIIDTNTFAYNPARINVGSIGYSENLENIIISSLYVCFKTDNTVNDNFLYQYLKTDFFNREVLRNVEGGVRDYLFYDNFARIKFGLPCIEEQKKIADYLSSIDSKIDIESQLLHKFEKQKRYLLANLFI
ncbi:restriction endonuclease subunit S [Myroides odoratimimus]|nr:restriction endonuclease subunit S [Myroides odoratimimus]MEC4034313.1 restriction endonuclease subunit S [Myroides odoratimimus]